MYCPPFGSLERAQRMRLSQPLTLRPLPSHRRSLSLARDLIGCHTWRSLSHVALAEVDGRPILSRHLSRLFPLCAEPNTSTEGCIETTSFFSDYLARSSRLRCYSAPRCLRRLCRFDDSVASYPPALRVGTERPGCSYPWLLRLHFSSRLAELHVRGKSTYIPRHMRSIPSSVGVCLNPDICKSCPLRPGKHWVFCRPSESFGAMGLAPPEHSAMLRALVTMAEMPAFCMAVRNCYFCMYLSRCHDEIRFYRHAAFDPKLKAHRRRADEMTQLGYMSVK